MYAHISGKSINLNMTRIIMWTPMNKHWPLCNFWICHGKNALFILQYSCIHPVSQFILLCKVVLLCCEVCVVLQDVWCVYTRSGDLWKGLTSISQQRVELQLIWLIAEISYSATCLMILVALSRNLVHVVLWALSSCLSLSMYTTLFMRCLAN